MPVDGDDGRRVLLATRLAMNYGFAYRMATYDALCRMARSAFGATASLVVDSPHNSIYEEEVGGTRAFVHRQNSCRAYPAAQMKDHPVFAKTGQPLLLPGTNRTSSYLCVPADSAHRSLYTSCHGSGSVISAFEASGRSGPDPLGRTYGLATATTAPRPPRYRISMTTASTRRSASSPDTTWCGRSPECGRSRCCRDRCRTGRRRRLGRPAAGRDGLAVPATAPDRRRGGFRRRGRRRGRCACGPGAVSGRTSRCRPGSARWSWPAGTRPCCATSPTRVLSVPPGAGQVLSAVLTVGLRMLRYRAPWLLAVALRAGGAVLVGRTE